MFMAYTVKPWLIIDGCPCAQLLICVFGLTLQTKTHQFRLEMSLVISLAGDQQLEFYSLSNQVLAAVKTSEGRGEWKLRHVIPLSHRITTYSECVLNPYLTQFIWNCCHRLIPQLYTNYKQLNCIKLIFTQSCPLPPSPSCCFISLSLL